MTQHEIDAASLVRAKAIFASGEVYGYEVGTTTGKSSSRESSAPISMRGTRPGSR